MPNRTYKINGYSAGGAIGSFTFHGQEVFNGAIPQAGDSENFAELFAFEMSTDVTGNIPSDITGTLVLTEGDATIVFLSANYTVVSNPAGTDSDGNPIAELTEAEVPSVFNEMYVTDEITTAIRNRILNGESIADAGLTPYGYWHNSVVANDTFTADYCVEAMPVK